MTKRILVTGAGGFSGRYMCKYLACLDKKLTITGCDISDSYPEECESFYKTDMSSDKEVRSLIRESRPDYIIHLAGSFGGKDVQQIYKINVLSVSSLLEATHEYSPQAVTVVVGSAAEYGLIDPELLPADEQTPCNPVTSYGLSKQLATQTALYYHRVHNMSVTVVRPFQLIGKGITSRLVPGAFAGQLREVIANGSNVMRVGNLKSFRDFLDVHDAVKAIWALCEKPAPGQIFNLCSGKLTQISYLLETMIDCCGVDVDIKVDPELLHGNADVSKIFGSYQKIYDHCGWKPGIDLEQSIKEMMTFQTA